MTAPGRGQTCEHSELGPMSTGSDGSVIAGAARCEDCGVLVMVTVDASASASHVHRYENVGGTVLDLECSCGDTIRSALASTGDARVQP